ncbi:hypothetical protein V498_05272, partial [Pseudogymnoascus sp. VKM F-4517 (FW-2822)]
SRPPQLKSTRVQEYAGFGLGWNAIGASSYTVQCTYQNGILSLSTVP